MGKHKSSWEGAIEETSWTYEWVESTQMCGRRMREYLERQLELGAPNGQARNLTQWKFLGIYKADSFKDS